MPVGDAEVEAVEHGVAPEALDDVDELDRVLAAVVADGAVIGELLVVGRALADALAEVALFAGSCPACVALLCLSASSLHLVCSLTLDPCS